VISAPALDMRGKRVLVMGLGVHGGGLGVTRYLAQHGAAVTVTDLCSAEQLAPTLAQLEGLPVRYVLGEHRLEDFRAAEVVVRNPGVPRESPFLAAARAAGAAIEMEMTLFFRLCRGPILGITGTKGKTTTTLLAGAMLKQQYGDTVVAGNLRVSALEQLPNIGRHTPVVLELSSWQLEGLGEAELSPRWACVTNLSEDHLDRYASMDAYAEAKAQILKHQQRDGVVVLNLADRWTRRMAGQARGEVVWFGGPGASQAVPAAGGEHDEPHGAWWSGERLVWRQGKQQETICSSDDVRLPGAHNLANVAAAAALARAFGVEAERIRAAIRGFGGVPDRMETVREIDGVRYVNDTTATAPAAAIAALQAVDRPVIVIAGGADKQLDFGELAECLAARAKAVVLLAGTATPKLEQALRRSLARRAGHTSLAVGGPFDALGAAVTAARDLAEPGDTVLLSPGCASFGIFRNEFDRGEQFRQLVQAL